MGMSIREGREGRRGGGGRVFLAFVVSLALNAGTQGQGIPTRSLEFSEKITDVAVVPGNGTLSGDADSLILLNLNDLFVGLYGPPELNTSFYVTRSTLASSFYVQGLPKKGKIYQAYRFGACRALWPGSCLTCCGSNTFHPPGQAGTCCAPQSDIGSRLYGIGDEIKSMGTRVLIRESGFIWYRPPVGEFGANFDSINVSAEFWNVDQPPITPQGQLNWNESLSGCAEDMAKCRAGATLMCTCTNMSSTRTAGITVKDIRRWPQVGFGGYMLSLDGGDDYFSMKYNKLPQWEFTLQLWFQQNRRRQGQTLLTYWSDERGREFEIFDTSNLQFYHLNNRSQPSGVGVNDGMWHHLAFAWRLKCTGEKKIRGGHYCDSATIDPTQRCIIDDVCLRVDITIIVDGVERATVSLPPFLPATTGTFLWGQRMVKPPKTVEQKFKDDLFAKMMANAPLQTSSILEPYVDNNLQLVYDNLRARSLTEDQLFGASVSKEAFRGPFTEREPWRDPYSKYCRLTIGGGFNPWTALSANIDEIRLYAYAKHADDVSLDMGYVINGDVGISFSPQVSNYSLIMYHSFDIDSVKFKQFQRDDYTLWPLDVKDFSPTSGVALCPDCVGLLGGGTFQYAPLQVPSTAPLFGARSIQVMLPDMRDPVPIDLIDAVRHPVPSTVLYTRIDGSPLFGDLSIGQDDCDNVLTQATIISPITYMPNPVCKGGLVGLGLLGTSGLFTSNCSVGDVMTASDGYGSGFQATVSTVNSGIITAFSYQSFGKGYDWTLGQVSNLTLQNPNCYCGTTRGNVAGAMNRCFRPLIHPGKADISGRDFTGISVDTGDYGFPINYQVSCAQGLCPVVKPRPCTYACHRAVGWATDRIAKTKEKQKQMVGPYGEVVNSGRPSVQWSNSRHTVWYTPLHIRKYPFYIKDADNVNILQDTISDEFLVRYWDYLPVNPLMEDPDALPPFVHMWVEIGLERLALPINTSFITEESSAVVTQLQVLDFDRGTSPFNAPFAVYVDPPTRGVLYQAIQISKNDTRFPSECVCWSSPRFPLANHTPENSYYPTGMELPSNRRCDVVQIGNFCMIRGAVINATDTLVQDVYNTRFLPGYQHSRDGFHVIYELGIMRNGLDGFTWRIKHPQGQVTDASVNIQVRSANKGPVALNGSALLPEDAVKVISLQGSDMDDVLVPTFHVTAAPQHGNLYQCVPRLGGGCDLGEPLSRRNESYIQWAGVTVDPAGAMDGKVYTMEEPVGANPPTLNISDVGGAPAARVLGGGYGYGTWSFDAPPAPGTRMGGNFREMCGSRGSIAAVLNIGSPVFVTGVEIFYPMRYDTPFRILAKKSLAVRNVSYDYRIDPATGVRGTINPSSVSIQQVGLIRSGAKEAIFSDAGQLTTSKSFTADTMTCDQPESSYTACRQIWDGSRWVLAKVSTAYTAEPSDEWVELYRGLPLLSSYHAPGEGRVAPIFPSSRVFSTELRIEACGQQGRVYADAPNFVQALKAVRVVGTRTARAFGIVSDTAKRVVYVPDPNFSGQDSFQFQLRDISGGSRTADSRFSRNQAWSPPAHVHITVTPTVDVPLGTNSVASAPPADGVGSVLIPIRGSSPTDGASPVVVAAYDVYIDSFPTSGTLLKSDGSVAPAVIPSESTGFVRYRPPANVCGFRYATFVYRLRLPGNGAFSAAHTGVIDVRCSQGNYCADGGTCQPCPPGEFGAASGVRDLCKLCPMGTYQPLSGQTGCINCTTGYYTDRPAQRRCRACAPGTFSHAIGASFCPSCLGGTIAPNVASTTCKDCGTISYTFGRGAFTCKDCPANTRSVIAAAPSIDYCACVEGTYDVLGRTGIPCKTCPPGAFCFGGKLLPVPRTGYYTNQSLWKYDTQNRTESIANNSVVTGDAYFAPCNYRYQRGVCIGYPDVNVQAMELKCMYRNSQVVAGPRKLDELTSAGIGVVVKKCTINDPRPGESNWTYVRPWISTALYANNSYCSEGYTGTICSSCSAGYRKQLEGICGKCLFVFDWHWTFGAAWFLTVLGAFLILWGIQFFFCAYPAQSMYILITHLQLLSVLGRFSVPWPGITQQMLNGFSFLNINVDALHWNCLGWDLEPYWQRWACEFVISPMIIFVVWSYHSIVVQDETEVAAASAIRAKMLQAREDAEKAKRKLAMLQAVDDDEEGPSAPTAADIGIEEIREEESETSSVDDGTLAGGAKGGPGGGMLAKGDRDHREPLTAAEIKKLSDRSIWVIIMLAHVLYVQACTIAVIPFSCSQISDSVTVLDWWPNLECDTPVHQRMRSAGAGYGVCLFIIIPSVMSYTMYKTWQNELFSDELYRQRFGWLFRAYEHKYFWWELLGLLRRAVLVACQGLFVHNGSVQLLVSISYLAMHLAATAYFQPHLLPRHNFIDMWLQAQLLLLACYGLTNVVGNEGMYIYTTVSGAVNDNTRIAILPPGPNMNAIADSQINSLWLSNLLYVVIIAISMGSAFVMVVFDLYEMKLSAPFWAPMVLNSVTGWPLYVWDEYVSRLLSGVDLFITRIRDRNKTYPPERPSSRWAHRAMHNTEVPRGKDFHAGRSVHEMLEEVMGKTLEHEWARNVESIREYVKSLDKRVFAAEMYNSKSANLPALERERNKAKKLLLKFMKEEGESTFRALYEQQGRNEQLVWDMQELGRKETSARVVQAGQEEHGKQLESQREEQKRRVGDIAKWKEEYLKEKKHCEELSRHVKQARDALVLYNLEESASSEDEKDLDDYLQKQITEYIDSKTARKLMEEGKLDPMLHLA